MITLLIPFPSLFRLLSSFSPFVELSGNKMVRNLRPPVDPVGDVDGQIG